MGAYAIDKGTDQLTIEGRTLGQVSRLMKHYSVGQRITGGIVEQLNIQQKAPNGDGWDIIATIKRDQPITTRQYLSYLFTGAPLPPAVGSEG